MAKLIPIIGAAVVALLLGGGAAWFLKPTSTVTVVAEETHAEPHYIEYTIKDRIVNLADPGGRRYIKTTIVLQVLEGKKAQAAPGNGESIIFVSLPVNDDGMVLATEQKPAGPAVLPNLAQVHDVITTVLSSKRSEEIMNTEGRERLREELRAKINAVMPKDQQVVKLLFTEFIVQ